MCWIKLRNIFCAVYLGLENSALSAHLPAVGAVFLFGVGTVPRLKRDACLLGRFQRGSIFELQIWTRSRFQM